MAFRRFLEIFVSAVTFLLFELESSLLKPKRVKKLFFLVKFFYFLDIFRFRPDTANFVDFGTFLRAFFRSLTRARLVPMTISGDNLMFGQPPIREATFLGTPSVLRNWPRKIFRIFFSLF